MAKFSLKGVFVPVTFSLISVICGLLSAVSAALLYFISIPYDWPAVVTLIVALAAIVLTIIGIKKREKKRVMIISGAVLGLAAIVVIAMRIIPVLMSYYEHGWAVY